MKLGYCFASKDNRILQPGDPFRKNFRSHTSVTTTQLYPNEICSRINLDDPDINICDAMDAIYCVVTSSSVDKVFSLKKKTKAKIIISMEAGEEDYTNTTIEYFIKFKRLFDAVDLILCMDRRAESLMYCMTDTKVIYWGLPYNTKVALDFISSFGDKNYEYDVFIPYGPFATQRNKRNGYVNCVIANELKKQSSNFKVAILDGVAGHRKYEALERSALFYDFMGFNFDIYPHLPYENFLRLVYHSKMIINLDKRRAAGKVAIEAGLCKTPAITSLECPFANHIFDQHCDAFNVAEAIGMANMIEQGYYRKDWIANSYLRSLEYDVSRKAEILDNALS